MSRYVPFAIIALLVPLLTAGKRKEPSMVGFHLEANEGDRPKKTTRVIIGTRSFRVKLEPSFVQSDIAGFYPFEAEDGRTYGVAFRLKPKSAKKLEAMTTAATGKRLFTVLGTDAVGYVLIDRPVDDGYVVCWKGLRSEHIKAFKGAFPQIEQAAPDAGLPAEDALRQR